MSGGRGQTLSSGAQQQDKGQWAQTEAEEAPAEDEEHEEELFWEVPRLSSEKSFLQPLSSSLLGAEVFFSRACVPGPRLALQKGFFQCRRGNCERLQTMLNRLKR